MWLVNWYDYREPLCQPILGEEYQRAKGDLLRTEIIPTFSFERRGRLAGGAGYIPERADAPIYMEAWGIFLAPPMAPITLASDDGSRLYLGGIIPLIDNWGMHGEFEKRATVILPPIVLLRLEWFDNCWSGVIRISGPLL